MGRIFFLIAGWLVLVASLRPALAQQVVCQQQQGQVIPQQGVNLIYRGSLTAVSPDSALLIRTTFPTGSYANSYTLPNPAGLVWVRRGSCDTARFASLAATKLILQGASGTQVTFIMPTRRRQIRVLHTFSTDSTHVRLYAFTRWGQLRWARTYGTQYMPGLAQGLAEAPDGGLYLSTIARGLPGTSITSLSKVDSLGQLKWQRTYASHRYVTTSRAFGFVRPVYTVRGNLLLAGTWNVDSVGVSPYGLVLEANQQGDSLTSRKFPARKPARVGVLVTGVRAVRDGGFLVVSRLDSVGRFTCGFTRLTANLQEQWTYIYRPTNSFKFSPPELSQGLELADGSLLGAFLLQKFGNNSVRFLRLSATGQLLQEYTVPSLTFAASSLAPLAADSSFVLGGADGSSGLASVLQVRLPGLRRVLAEPPLPPAQVVLAARGPAAFPAPAYPNPAAESVTVPLLPSPVAGKLTLLDLAGRRVLAQPVAAGAASATLAVGAVAAGTYLLRYEVPGQLPAIQRLTVAR
jgi:hypothetical protein